ncbi:MAG: hypothetical protein ACTSSP_08320 [Candidatus Asgardarchaeia archaeon]
MFIKGELTFKEITLIGYVASVFFMIPLFVALPYYMSHNIPILGYDIREILWNVAMILIVPPVLSIIFYKVVTLNRKYATPVVPTLVAFIFYICLFLTESLVKGNYIYLLEPSLLFYFYFIIGTLVLGFMQYAAWVLSLEIYWKFKVAKP